MDKVKEFLRLFLFTVGGGAVGGILLGLIVPALYIQLRYGHDDGQGLIMYITLPLATIIGVIVGWSLARSGFWRIKILMGVGAWLGALIFFRVLLILLIKVRIVDDYLLYILLGGTVLGSICGAILINWLARKRYVRQVGS